MEHSGHDKMSTDKIANEETPSSEEQDPPTNIAENNKVLQQALGPLVAEFKLLRIPKGPYKQYSITKLRVQEMIVVTIDSGNREDDLTKAKEIDITSCNRVGRYKHNVARPISVTFATRDDKESFLSSKRKLPSGIFANKELPLHIKKR